ncbi:MAG: hypothetical protein OEW67_09215 [Cyclobacteriaceae bacterium]|nr:hypothetical protein [Cyclobacteriaceae bacterium]
MDLQALDKDLQQIILKKNELSILDYSSDNYDDIEEQLHDMEDKLLTNYGDYLEEALYDVHDEFCPDSEVLLPIAYLAKKYIVKGDKYDVDFSQGVYVEMDDYPQKETKLVFIANPTRILLLIDEETREVVWQAGK